MDYDVINGYTHIGNFDYAAVTFPYRVHDALVVRGEEATVLSPSMYNGCASHREQEYVEHIRKHQLEKAVLILKDFHMVTQCPSLKHLHIYPSNQAPDQVDFSPLYQLPELCSLHCSTRYGDREQYSSKIDYAKMPGLEMLSVCAGPNETGYQRLEHLKTLGISRYHEKNGSIRHLFTSRELDSLRMIQCRVSTLDGIETTPVMQWAEFSYMRSLQDISALRGVRHTLKSLVIDCCAGIKDFSVLYELESLERLSLIGSNTLPSLDFIRYLPNLKTFSFSMNVLDGDLSPCMELEFAGSLRDRRHYNLKNDQLPKGNFTCGNESIEIWRRYE